MLIKSIYVDMVRTSLQEEVGTALVSGVDPCSLRRTHTTRILHYDALYCIGTMYSISTRLTLLATHRGNPLGAGLLTTLISHMCLPTSSAASLILTSYILICISNTATCHGCPQTALRQPSDSPQTPFPGPCLGSLGRTLPQRWPTLPFTTSWRGDAPLSQNHKPPTLRSLCHLPPPGPNTPRPAVKARARSSRTNPLRRHWGWCRASSVWRGVQRLWDLLDLVSVFRVRKI